jgi:hypothetical protein
MHALFLFGNLPFVCITFRRVHLLNDRKWVDEYFFLFFANG